MMPIDHLPPRLRARAERLRDFLMTDATVLLILGMECAARGVSYLQNPPPAHPAERAFSLAAWAVTWTAVGVACLVSSVRHWSPPATLAFSLAVGLNALWSVSFILGAVQADHQTAPGWGETATYGAVATMALWSVWRGSRTEIRMRGGRP